jgi:hypothetical protein
MYSTHKFHQKELFNFVEKSATPTALLFCGSQKELFNFVEKSATPTALLFCGSQKENPESRTISGFSRYYESMLGSYNCLFIFVKRFSLLLLNPAEKSNLN